MKEGSLEMGSLLPHRPGNPIQGSQFIQHRPSNPKLRIGLECHILLGIKLAEGIHQSDQSGADQILRRDMGGKSHGQSMGNIFDERGIL
jgi:hypothetical protein